MEQMDMRNASEAAISVNPSTGKRIAEYPFHSDLDASNALEESSLAFEKWRLAPLHERTSLLKAMAAELRHGASDFARLVVSEMGKPLSEALAEVNKCAVLCDWYAEHAASIVSRKPTSVPEGKAYISYLPIGTILAVMPWNFPLWQVMRGAVPIIASGNTYLLKHAPNVMGCALALGEAWRRAGLPKGVFNILNVSPQGVSKAIADNRVAAVTVTGSARAGASIAAQAGAALKKTVLELGGSDPYIVLADAEIDEAVRNAVIARFQNAGQVCIAAKRIILERPIADEFTSKFVSAVRNLRVGNPSDPDVKIGPMARDDLRVELHEQVQKSIAAGAQLLTGGEAVPGDGFFYKPTVLGAVRPGMSVFDEETFGPVAALIVADDDAHALVLANNSEYGLSSAIWTKNLEKAHAFARSLQTGGVFINGTSTSDPRVPIGGVKKSGYGRELSHSGILEFMNSQTVWVDRS